MSGSVLKLIIFISLLFDLAVSQDPPDPCTTYTPIPDSERRGINYTLSNGESSIDDNELTEGWYGDKRYTLVEESPGFYKCGGWYPIYIQQRTNKVLTMCVQTPSDACAYNISVEARQCSGFKVYHLPQAPVHRAVYCLAASSGAPPQFYEKPRISVELMDKKDTSELLFWCNFTRSSDTLFYKTIWYVEGTPIYTFEPLEWNSDDFDYIADRALTEQLLKDNGVEKAGFNLQCGVQALYSGGATSSGELSEVQFVGVKIIQDNSQPLFEGETRTIPLKLTVPFGCGTLHKSLGCEFFIDVIRIQKKGLTGLSAVVENSCNLHSIKSTKWRQGTSVSVIGKITPSYGKKTATTHLKLKTPSKTGGELSSLWTDYEIGLVTIQIAKNTTQFQSKTCFSRNDPQIGTFDFTSFYLGHSAVYTLYSASNDIVVQIQTEDCGRHGSRFGPFCTCGVAVRAGRTVFEISHCTSLTWHIGYTACGDDGDVLQVRRERFKKYMIYLPTGNTVPVQIIDHDQYHLVNVYVTSSVNDVGKSRGICGNLSATSDDDLIKRDGSLAISTEDFAESWRVAKNDSLFDPEVIRAGLKSYKPLLQYCTCEDKTLTCTAMAATATAVPTNSSVEIKPKNCVISKRKKRMALRTPKRSKRQVQTSGGWFNGWNETLAQAYCEDKFSESKAVKVCGDVPGVNVANSKHECVKDIQLSGTDAFVSMAVESVYTNCFREALVNPILNMSEPGKPSVFEKITEEICTQDCSKRGVCEKGQCRCNPGFGGGDCSVELSNPPTLFDVGDGGHCDLAAGKCIETAVLGDIFSGEESSRCQIKKSMVKQDGQMAISSVTTSKAVTESISEVTCYLPEPLADDVTISYNISVSNIGTFYSNELTVLVYDSTCVSVDNDTMIWSLRDGYCTHKGKCVMEGDTMEEDACVSCEINGNQRIWKTATGGICGNRAGNVSGERVFVMLGLLVAAAAALNHSQ